MVAIDKIAFMLYNPNMAFIKEGIGMVWNGLIFLKEVNPSNVTVEKKALVSRFYQDNVMIVVVDKRRSVSMGVISLGSALALVYKGKWKGGEDEFNSFLIHLYDAPNIPMTRQVTMSIGTKRIELGNNILPKLAQKFF